MGLDISVSLQGLHIPVCAFAAPTKDCLMPVKLASGNMACNRSQTTNGPETFQIGVTKLPKEARAGLASLLGRKALALD